MSTPSNLSEQVLAIPAGAGDVRSAGETFIASPQTGTGSYSIPLRVEPGAAGITPALALAYGTHAGSGEVGLGWSLALATISRRTDRGIPTYDDLRDRFALQGDELVHVGGGAYRQRSESRFARVRHVQRGGRDFWVVTERDGTRVFYGYDVEGQVRDDAGRVLTWYPTKKQDVHGNEVVYSYTRDAVSREVRLVQVAWGGCYRVLFAYEERPDPVVSAMPGFVHAVNHRLTTIDVQVVHGPSEEWRTYLRYGLTYETSRWTGRSLLGSVRVTGIAPSGTERDLPDLVFTYADPVLSERRWHAVMGDVPGEALSARGITLVMQSGSGLPDVLETRATGQYYRENVGGGRLAPARRVAAPGSVSLADPGVFLSDMNGDGYADLVVQGGRHVYRMAVGGGWGESYSFPTKPAVDFDAPGVRLADLTGNGLPDVLRAGVAGWDFFENLGDGRWAPPVRILRPPDLRLDDSHVHLVDVTGDGLADLVYIDRFGARVYPALGRGAFGAPYTLLGAPALGVNFDVAAVRFADITGSGQADLIYVQSGLVRAWLNHAGRRLEGPLELGRAAMSSHGHVEPADFLGTGAKGLVFSDRAYQGGAWRFLEMFPAGPPDLLTEIDNGMGGATRLTYGSSAAHWARDRAAGRPWKTAMPSAQRVVDEVRTTDSVTGLVLGVRYQYRHGVYDSAEREFRGFGSVEQIDVEAEQDDPQPLAPTRTVRWYHTGADVDVDDEFSPIVRGNLEDEVPPYPDARRALRGLLRREEVFTLDGNARPYRVTQTVSRVFPIWRSPSSGRGSWAALPVHQRVTYTERTVDARELDTTTTYDLHSGRGYGLPTLVREIGRGRRGSYATAHEQAQTAPLERYSTTSYVSLDESEPDEYGGAYTPVYVVGKPSVEERYAVTGTGDVLLARTRSYYDGDPYEGNGAPGSGTTVGVTKGLLASQMVLAFTDDLLDATYPSGAGDGDALTNRGKYVAIGSEHYVWARRLAYTANGQVSGFMAPNAEVASTFEYDGAHDLFPVLYVDSLGHPTEVTRGAFPFRVESVLDANGNTTSYTYDPTGLPSSRSLQGKESSLGAGDWSGDPPSHPSEVYEYDFDAAPVKITVKTRQVREGATFDVHRYVDGLGQVVQERHTGEPHHSTPSTPRFRVTGWQVRNHKGLVVRAYQPVFSTSGEYATGDQSTASVETTYDPLGRPIRVDYPDGTFETTTYHPWVQELRDRNDNADGITATAFTDRYEDFEAKFEGHYDTPTKKYVDALGRDIAVSEDAGGETSVASSLRSTTYAIEATQFTGTTYALTLSHPLSADYFVLISGTQDATGARADNVGVRVTKDPFGTGDLTASSAENVIELTRSSSSGGDWLGTVTVVECLGGQTTSGFKLVDVKGIAPGTHTTGSQTTTVTTNAAWDALARVAVYGGPRGGGSTADSADNQKNTSLHGKLVPFEDGGATKITLTRHGGGVNLAAANFTVYVVEWGSEHTVQRVSVTGTAGGAGVDATGEYNTASISSVTRAQTWCWMSGYTNTAGNSKAFSGLVLALGDGVNQNATETSVAVGSRSTANKDVLVTVHSHASFAVDWLFSAEGNGSSATLNHTVDGLTEPLDEVYDEVSNPRTTEGARVGVHTNTTDGTGHAYEQVLFFARHTAEASLTATRSKTGEAWAAWVQSVDFSAVAHDTRRTHVTRSVLDLKDQVVEVWDARELDDATWKFTYDLAGRRIVSEHTTALGTRHALADAAGNPIWSRDARAIEVDRTFDALSRPLTESSDDGTTVKLRRAWNYVEYDDEHVDFESYQAKNLFGRVEEQRDADGLRYFEYDHRGLVTKASHKFWDHDWENTGATAFWDDGAAYDPATPSDSRGTYSSWLALQHLTNTTTVEVTTMYDAAGRPTEVVYPEGMKTRNTYHISGMIRKIEADRGTGGGYGTIVDDARYNARGQISHYEHGNGVHTSREYDEAIERLIRVHSQKVGGTTVDYQDLNYAYDPVGNPMEIEDALTNVSYASNRPIPNTRSFEYDARYRLIRAQGRKLKTVGEKTINPYDPTPSSGEYEDYDFKYRYDEVGNFTRNHEYSRGQLHYKADRIDLFNGDGREALDSDPEGGNFTYDANGNTTKTPRHQEMAYTHDNQPRYVDMGGGTEVRYLRHGDLRVLRFVKKSGIRALGVYIGPWEYHERQGTGARTKTVMHVQGHGRHAQAEVLLDGTDSTLVSLLFVHGDHLGSGHVLTNTDGTMLSQEEYFPYGRASDRRDSRNRYRFIGVEQDEETGLCMTGPRTYDPVSGRFLQGDAVQGSANTPFGYSRAQPTRRVDPTGYWDEPPPPTPTVPDAAAPVPPAATDLSSSLTVGSLPETVSLGALGEQLAETRATTPAGNERGRTEIGANLFRDYGGELIAGPGHQGEKYSVPLGQSRLDDQRTVARSLGRNADWVGWYHTHPDESGFSSREGDARTFMTVNTNSPTGAVSILERESGRTTVAVRQTDALSRDTVKQMGLPGELQDAQLAYVLDRAYGGKAGVYAGDSITGDLDRVAPDPSGLSDAFLRRLDRVFPVQP